MTTAAESETTQYLSFTLGDETFSVDVAKVREILEFKTVTKVPRTPEFMCGVINLRGSVVPVIDMRLKFGITATETTVNTCIIVLEVSVDGETTVVGALADSVKEVLEMESDQIEPAPKIGTRLNTEFIKGMGKQNEEFIIILDIDKIFGTEEMLTLQQSTESVAA